MQADPVYPDAHTQVPGLEHVPPFEHTGEQTAENQNINNIYSHLLN